MTFLWNGEQIQEVALLLAIADYKRPTPQRLPSMEYLAFLAGMTKEEAEVTLYRLYKKNWLTFTPQVDGRIEINYSGFHQEIESYMDSHP